MRTKQRLLGLIFTMGMGLISFSSQAADYTTLTNGDWGDASIWSLDGVTQCNCRPGYVTNGDNIIINHTVATDQILTINSGSILRVNANGQLVSSVRIFVDNSTLNFLGDATFTKLEAENGSRVYITGAIVTLTNRFELQGSDMIIDGGLLYMSGGNVSAISPNSTLTLTNEGKVNIASGNLDNEGTVTIEDGCCITTSGNWKNYAGGTIIGEGAALSTNGNMTNNGSWDPNISWCAYGTFNGTVPSPEDCSTSSDICNGIVLPTELASFEVLLVDDYAMILWSTASERNSDKFVIYRSDDATTWMVVGEIDAATNSEDLLEYQYLDRDLPFGTYYYRLKQLDHNGDYYYSTVKSIERKQEAATMVFPNPAENCGCVTVANLKTGKGQVLITDGAGNVLDTIEKGITDEEIRIDITNYEKGIYFAKIVMTHETETIRFVVLK